MAEKILVTSALPYANGPIHIGHIVEYVQTDIYVRFLRSCGKDVVYFCADDTHGTPIELNAAKQGIKPEEFIAALLRGSTSADFQDFGVSVDCFHSTNSPENRHYAELIYGRLKEHGRHRAARHRADLLREGQALPAGPLHPGHLPQLQGARPVRRRLREVRQGLQPHGPHRARSARCAARRRCGGTPTHLFFKLSRHEDFLQDAAAEGRASSTRGWPRSCRASSRRAWRTGTSAATGRTSASRSRARRTSTSTSGWTRPSATSPPTEKWAKETGKAKSALDYWAADSRRRASSTSSARTSSTSTRCSGRRCSKVAGLQACPTSIKVHGHLTVNGEKMSKSRGTLITARTYLDAAGPELPALLLRGEPRAGARGLRPQPQGLPPAGERRAGQQHRQPRQPRAVHAGGPAGEAARAGSREGPGKALVEAALARVPEVREAFEKLEYRTAIKRHHGDLPVGERLPPDAGAVGQA